MKKLNGYIYYLIAEIVVTTKEDLVFFCSENYFCYKKIWKKLNGYIYYLIAEIVLTTKEDLVFSNFLLTWTCLISRISAYDTGENRTVLQRRKSCEGEDVWRNVQHRTAAYLHADFSVRDDKSTTVITSNKTSEGHNF